MALTVLHPSAAMLHTTQVGRAAALRRRNIRPRLDSTARELVRLLCFWLVALLLVQSLSATYTLVHGMAHRHADAVAAHLGEAHAHWHAQDTAHHHSADELMLPLAADAQGLHAASLLLALGSALAPALHGLPPAGSADALPAYGGQQWADHLPPPPRKPPRA